MSKDLQNFEFTLEQTVFANFRVKAKDLDAAIKFMEDHYHDGQVIDVDFESDYPTVRLIQVEMPDGAIEELDIIMEEP